MESYFLDLEDEKTKIETLIQSRNNRISITSTDGMLQIGVGDILVVVF